jgi:hypothetical protein
VVAENDKRILLRLERSSYQTLGAAHEEYPYGLIVLPRREGKPYILEYNTQSYIGGPPIWKEFTRLTLAKPE